MYIFLFFCFVQFLLRSNIYSFLFLFKFFFCVALKATLFLLHFQLWPYRLRNRAKEPSRDHDSLITPKPHSFIHSFIFIHLFVHSALRSFVRSFIHSYICLFVRYPPRCWYCTTPLSSCTCTHPPFHAFCNSHPLQQWDCASQWGRGRRHNERRRLLDHTCFAIVEFKRLHKKAYHTFCYGHDHNLFPW